MSTRLSPCVQVQMVSYKIVKADNGDAWVEVILGDPWQDGCSGFVLVLFHIACFQTGLPTISPFTCRLEESGIHQVRSVASFWRR
jgi:hypothetical protein